MIDLSWVQLVVAVLIPLAVGVVTKEVTNAGVKAVALAAFSAAAGLLTSYINNKGVFTEAALQEAVTYFVVAVGAYYGFLKPTGVAPAVQAGTKNFGI